MEKKNIYEKFLHIEPTPEQQANYLLVRQSARDLANTINELCPEGREKSLAITKIEEAVMWANKSISVNER